MNLIVKGKNVASARRGIEPAREFAIGVVGIKNNKNYFPSPKLLYHIFEKLDKWFLLY